MDKNNIYELKEQLVRFHFSSYCFGFAGSIELINNGIDIKYKYNDSYNEEKDRFMEYEFSMDRWNEFVNELLSINIHKWKEEYVNKDFSLDCEEWKVEMEFKNK